MNKKYKLKKSAIVIILLFLVLIVALVILINALLSTKSYSIDYNIDDYDISENYDNNKKQFYYEITYNEVVYNFIIKGEYQKDKKLINDIRNYEEEDYTCLVIKSDFIKTNPLCSYKKSLIDYHLVLESIQEKMADYYHSYNSIEKKYDNYTLYDSKTEMLIWSYKGFNYIHDDKIDFIKIFDKDIYEIPMATKINEFMMIPDYEQEHNFNKVYIINLNTQEIDTWKLKYEISFDSYILGTNDKSIFIIDKKNKVEYELVPHKKKMRIVAKNSNQGIIYKDGESTKISVTKLASTEQKFTYFNNYKYQLKDNTLFLSYLNSDNKIRISNKKVDSIVHINNDNVYYLVDDTLYKYNLKYGEIKVIKYSEWEFNNKNLIFIND